MKKNTLLFLCIFAGICAQATIRRVNNNAIVTGPNVYTTAQAAHNAAVAGDTIHLEPTVNGSYGNITITKQLVVISTGDFLSLNPGTQLSFLPVGTCDGIYLGAGSSNTIIHAKCTGIAFNASVNNVTISRSHITGSITFGSNTTCNNIVIKQNMIDGSISAQSSTIVCNNLLVSNNFIYQGIAYSCSSQAIFVNNVICYGYNTISNSIFSNNIIIAAYAFTFNNCNVSGNVSAGTQLPAGNVNSENMANVFANWPFSSPTSTDQYQLKPSYSNQAIGMYAGSDPYRRACTPPVPSIYEFTVPASASGNNMNITVSTKSNN
jgi:hypothetical protein